MGKMRLVILAAGKGKRLKPLTDETPKALLEFGGLTITERIIDAFSGYVNHIVIVVGHLGDKIKERLGEERNGVPIIYYFNKAYSFTGAGRSLWLARREWAGKPCVVMEGDHLISPELARRLVANHYLNAMLVDDVAAPKFDEETVMLGRGGIVKSLAWPASDLPEDDRQNVVGEALTIFKLSPSAGASLAQRLDGGEIIAPINQILSHHRMHYLSTGLLPWLEIDTPKDLERAYQVYQAVEAT